MHAVKDIDAPLSRMPLPVIKGFRAACLLATACVVLLIVIGVGGGFLELTPEGEAGTLLGISLAWFVSCWLLSPVIDTPQAIGYGFSRSGRQRRAVRVLAIGWIGAAAAHAVLLVSPPTVLSGGLGDVAVSVRGAGVLVGLASLFMLALLLQRLAAWTRDGDAEQAFNVALWGIPITTVLMFLSDRMLVVGILIAIVWVICMCAFPFGLISLSSSVSWSIRHSREYTDRLRRRQARVDEYDEQIADSVRRMDQKS